MRRFASIRSGLVWAMLVAFSIGCPAPERASPFGERARPLGSAALAAARKQDMRELDKCWQLAETRHKETPPTINNSEIEIFRTAIKHAKSGQWPDAVAILEGSANSRNN